MEFLSTGSNVALILLGFGLLVCVHELGHFAAARWAGIRCENFAVGMGPVLLAFRKGIGVTIGSTDPRTVARCGRPAMQMSLAELRAAGISETEYSLRMLPLGGFVRMRGQEDLAAAGAAAEPGSYLAAPIWKRMIVVSAGVISNVILAVALFIVSFMVGVRFEAPVIGEVAEGTPAATTLPTNAAEAGVTKPGLQPMDEVLTIDGDPITTFSDIQIAAGMSKPDSALHLRVRRPGVSHQVLDFTITPQKPKGGGLRALGVGPAHGTTLFVPHRADERTAYNIQMALAGLDPATVLPGSTLVQVQHAPAATLEALLQAAEASSGQSLACEWRLPQGGEVTTQVQPTPEFQMMLVPRTFTSPAPAGARAASDGPEVLPVPGLLGLTMLTQVTWIEPTSPNVGVLQPGDIILRMGNLTGPAWSAIQQMVPERKNASIPTEVLRDGKPVELTVQVTAEGKIGMVGTPAWHLPLAGTTVRECVSPDAKDTTTTQRTPGSTLDMPPLSRITSVAGKPVSTWVEIRAALQDVVQRHGTSSEPLAVPIAWSLPTAGNEPATGTLHVTAAEAADVAELGWSCPIGSQAFDPLWVELKADGSPLKAVTMGLDRTRSMIAMTYLTLDRLFRGSVGVDQLRGPVGIVHLGTHVADRGLTYVVFFLAMISVNLAVLNFLPLPIVDGGLFLYLVYEKIRGRQPSVAFQNAAIVVGLCLLGSVFLFTFYNDVTRIFTGR
ncbi:MAG: site-2 protease family protein [Phycisphaerales bacterium]